MHMNDIISYITLGKEINTVFFVLCYRIVSTNHLSPLARRGGPGGNHTLEHLPHCWLDGLEATLLDVRATLNYDYCCSDRFSFGTAFYLSYIWICHSVRIIRIHTYDLLHFYPHSCLLANSPRAYKTHISPYRCAQWKYYAKFNKNNRTTPQGWEAPTTCTSACQLVVACWSWIFLG